jgi:hypothetical protein
MLPDSPEPQEMLVNLMRWRKRVGVAPPTDHPEGAECARDSGLGLVWGDVELHQVGFETLRFGGTVGYSYGHPDGAEEHGVVA